MAWNSEKALANKLVHSSIMESTRRKMRPTKKCQKDALPHQANLSRSFFFKNRAAAHLIQQPRHCNWGLLRRPVTATRADDDNDAFRNALSRHHINNGEKISLRRPTCWPNIAGEISLLSARHQISPLPFIIDNLLL
jgi:hypothetical protein